MRESPRIQFWEGVTLPLWDGLTLINCGGHFEGGTVLHWPAARAARRIAYGRHHYRGARPALCQFHAKLSEPDSARSRCNSSHSRCDRAILVRSNLRRLVESERPLRRESRSRAIGGTLSALDQSLGSHSFSHRFAQRTVLCADLWPVSSAD